MAQNYLQFSFAIDLKSVEEQKWCAERLGFLGELEDGNDWSVEEGQALQSELAEWPLVKQLKDDGIALGFSWEVEDFKLYIWAAESGDAAQAALFLREYLRKWDPTGTVEFEWSYSCSKPRVDEFGGGAVLVTKDDYFSASTCDLLVMLREQARKGR